MSNFNGLGTPVCKQCNNHDTG